MRMPRRSLSARLVGLVLLAIPAVPIVASAQQVRFEARVSRVRVNVIVNDAEGRFVDDLRAEDFLLFEDDEPREIIDLQLVDLEAGDVTTLLAGGSPGDGAGKGAGVPVDGGGAPPIADSSAAAAPQTAIDVPSRFGAIVFFIDFIGLDHVTKLHFTNQWERYLREKETTAVPQAVYLIDQVGVLREIAPLTADMDTLRAAQETVEATPLTSRYSVSEGESGARQQAFEEYDRAVYSFRMLRQFCDALAARPGRTALVWVSRGLDLKAGLHARGFGPNARLLEMQDELVVAANTGNVSLYGVDPSRLIDLFGGDASATRAGSVRDELGDTLRYAAAETGGEHFIAWADFGEVVGNIERDSARYYLLTYAGATEGDGAYHTIRVEVNRRDLDVRSTTGYVDHDEEERRSRFVSAALTLPGTVNELPVTAEVSTRGGSGSRSAARVTVRVAGGAVGIRPDEDGRPIQRIEVHGVLLNDDKEIVAEMHRQVTETLDDDSGPVDELVSRHNDWLVRPGNYELRVMAIDDATGRVGTAVIEVRARRR